MKSPDLIGQQFGRLLVLAQGARKGRYITWACLCDCGRITNVKTAALLNSSTRSCGCLVRDRLKELKTAHGQARKRNGEPKTGAYSSWAAMKYRCKAKSGATLKNYSGRGITYAPEWEKFENFYKDMGDRPPSKSLDRINNALGYTPQNCRWATPSEQSQNRRNVKC